MNNWVFGAISLVSVLAFPCLPGGGWFHSIWLRNMEPGGEVLVSGDIR